VISPLLSNIYLDPLDHRMAQLGYEMVRYADDFVILCRTPSEAQSALAEVEAWTVAAGLRLHPEKTRIVDATQRGGFDFLGYHFERGYRWPSRKSLGKFKDKIRAKTKRNHGHSLQRILSELVPIQRGWFEYFKHSLPSYLAPLDKWIRMRLRSILRRRLKRKGRSRGRDHNRWPNAFFAEQGLYYFVTAFARARQSSRR
jgi:RNA-directed DNA polymerase